MRQIQATSQTVACPLKVMNEWLFHFPAVFWLYKMFARVVLQSRSQQQSYLWPIIQQECIFQPVLMSSFKTFFLDRRNNHTSSLYAEFTLQEHHHQEQSEARAESIELTDFSPPPADDYWRGCGSLPGLSLHSRKISKCYFLFEGYPNNSMCKCLPANSPAQKHNQFHFNQSPPRLQATKWGRFFR